MEMHSPDSENSLLTMLPGIHAEVIAIMISFAVAFYIYTYQKVDELKFRLDNLRLRVSQVTDITTPSHRKQRHLSEFGEYMDGEKTGVGKVVLIISILCCFSEENREAIKK
jgi:hypothetical protein